MKSRMMQALGVCGLVMALAACGGGSDGGGGAPPVAAPLSGVFIDSPVQGLHYTTSSGLSGFTDASGQYNYRTGDTVIFDIGGRPINTAGISAGPVVTALSIFGATSTADQQVVNLSRLLLTLAGGAPSASNVIQLPATLPPLPSPINFNVPTTTFAGNIAAAGGGTGPTLVPELTATAHLATNFSTVSVTLLGSGSGGVASNPSGITCSINGGTSSGTCTAVLSNNFSITLTPTGSGFAGWSGGTGSATGCNGTNGACTFTPTSNSNITATFNVPPPNALTILPNPGNGVGAVTCSNDGGATFGQCSTTYANGTALILKATANGGSTFTGWSGGTGNATVCPNSPGNCSFTLNTNTVVTANFALNAVTQFSVVPGTATGNGGGGTVQCSANSGTPGSCGTYPVNTLISVIPAPNSASLFSNWSNGTGSVNANCSNATGACTFTLTANTSITANFNRPTLTVNVAGTGSVSSNPTGINSCSTNCSAPFNKGQVILTASGAGFTGWSGGGCSGSSPCTVTLNADTTVTASFGQVTTSSRWLFYTNNTGTIGYVDPANPGAVTTPLTTTGSGPNHVIAATWDATNASFVNLTEPYLIYLSGGKWWRVSALKGSGVPGSANNPPVQFSNEAAAAQFCDEEQIGGAQAGNVAIIYQLPGADNICATLNDNVTKIVKVLDGATTSPTSLAPGLVQTAVDGITWVTDLSTGAPTHIFLLDAASSNTLKIMNVATNAITTIQSNVGPIDSVVQDTSDRVFLYGGGTQRVLYLYTISTNSLVTLVTGASRLNRAMPDGDGTNLYMAEQVSGKLYKVPMSASGPGDVITLSEVPFPLGDTCGEPAVVLTTNNVFLETFVSNSTGVCALSNFAQDAAGLYRVSKTTGAVTPIIAHAPGTGVMTLRSVKDLVYYNHQLPSSIPQAVIIKEDGTPVFSSPITCPGCTAWDVTIIDSPSFSVRTSAQPLSKIILGCSNYDASCNGRTLTVFDAPTGTQGVALGTIPNPTSPVVGILGGGNDIDTVKLFSGFQQNGNSLIFFADTVLPGSLTQVPTPAAGLWFPVLF